MKKMIICLIFTGLFIWQSSAQQVIQRPEYKFRNTGTLRIEKITLSCEATTLQLVSEFIPGWWVVFSPEKMYLEDPFTSKRYAPTGIEGIQWGEKKTTPQSGVDTFHFIFPPLPQGTKEINLITEDDAIYGIRLDGSNYYSAIFPQEFIGNWRNTEGIWQYGIYEKFVVCNKLYSDVGILLLDFVMYREDIGLDPKNKAPSTPVSNSYFKFLSYVDLNNEYLLVPHTFRLFIHRLDSRSPLANARYAGYPQPAITPEKYGLENIPTLTPEEKDLLSNQPDLNQIRIEERIKEFRKNMEKQNQI